MGQKMAEDEDWQPNEEVKAARQELKRGTGLAESPRAGGRRGSLISSLGEQARANDPARNTERQISRGLVMDQGGGLSPGMGDPG